jgi:hypothetical protein
MFDVCHVSVPDNMIAVLHMQECQKFFYSFANTCTARMLVSLQCRPDDTRVSSLTAADEATSWRNDKPVAQPSPTPAPVPATEKSADSDGRKEGRSDTEGTWEKAPQPPPAPESEESQNVESDSPSGGPVKSAEASKVSKGRDGQDHWGVGKKTLQERENVRRDDVRSGNKSHQRGGCGFPLTI